MESHRNPSPPDSPTLSPSHDLTSSVVGECDNQIWNESGPQLRNSSPLIGYDDCIGDTVFSKAWVLSILVKAVQTVEEPQSKIELFGREEDGTDRREESTCRGEEAKIMLSARDVKSIVGNTLVEGTTAQGVGMESSESDFTLERDRPGANGGVMPPLHLYQRDDEGKGSDADDGGNLTERRPRETHGSGICLDTDKVKADQQERVDVDGEGEREGDDLVDEADDLRGMSSLSGLSEISENLENDLCQLWDASMNLVCLIVHVCFHLHMCISIATHL